MIIHNSPFSSQSLLKSASIHDTPSAKDAPDPIAIDHVSFHDIRELEADKVYEPAPEIRFSASIKDDSNIYEQIEAVVKEQEIAEETRRRRQAKKAKKQNKGRSQSRRKQRKKDSLKKPRKNQNLNPDHAFLTHEWRNWKNEFPLDDFQTIYMLMFWPQNNNACSLGTIVKELRKLNIPMSKCSIRCLDKFLVENGYISLEKQFVEYKHKKKKQAIKTKKQTHFYRKVTPKGRAFREAILNLQRFGIPIPEELKPNIAIVTTKAGQKVPKRLYVAKPSEQKQVKKKFEIQQKSVKEILGTLTSIDKSIQYSQEDPADPEPAFEGKNKVFFDPEAVIRRYDDLLKKQLDIDDSRSALFEIYNLKNLIPMLPSAVKKRINACKPSHLVKTLKFVRKRLDKNYQPRNLVSFFIWRFNMEKDPTPWLTKRAQEVMEAIKKNQSTGGVDLDAVVLSIGELQKTTGQKITEQELYRLLLLGTHLVKIALDFVVFRSKCFKVTNWIGYVRDVAKKPIFEILKMYKASGAMT